MSCNVISQNPINHWALSAFLLTYYLLTYLLKSNPGNPVPATRYPVQKPVPTSNHYQQRSSGVCYDKRRRSRRITLVPAFLRSCAPEATTHRLSLSNRVQSSMTVVNCDAVRSPAESTDIRLTARHRRCGPNSSSSQWAYTVIYDWPLNSTYTQKPRPGLVALYDIRPGYGVGLFLQPRSPHGAIINRT